jgi:beta-lactam-binding protein with PASTA domain
MYPSAMARFWRRRPTTATRTTEEQVERVPPPPPRPFWPWLLLLLLLVLGALAASWYFATRDETVDAEKVPNVVGLQRADAERRLDERGFETEVKPVDSRQPPGEVIAQRPSPETVYGEGGIVVISVARSPSEVEVPDVVGLRTQVALTRLRTAGLNPRAQAVQSRRPKGIVLRQVPPAGTEVQRGSAAVVVVSAGPQLAEVPDVVGLDTEAATEQLTQAGFRTQVQRVPGNAPEGTVVAQNPRGGTRAQRGRVVRINVSIGQTQTTTTVVTTTTAPSGSTVPNTVGQDEATARSTLEGAGFQVRVTYRTVTDPSQEGIVMTQSPAGGRAAPGSTVTITVGRLR